MPEPTGRGWGVPAPEERKPRTTLAEANQALAGATRDAARTVLFFDGTRQINVAQVEAIEDGVIVMLSGNRYETALSQIELLAAMEEATSA